jgi:cellulase
LHNVLGETISHHNSFWKKLTLPRVNGNDNGELVGIRSPTSNNPIQNVNDGNIACNSGFKSPVSSKVINVKGGDRVGINWGHVIGGAQFPNDVDHPIAKSHKGPTIFYM